MKVLKFGGSSMANAENIEKVVRIVKHASENNACVVVLSAMQGTTDELIDAGRTAERGDDGFLARLAEIADKHTMCIRALFSSGHDTNIADYVESLLKELESISEGVRRVRELTPKTLDRLLSFGEIASSKMLSEKLAAEGIQNEWHDSRHLIRTDSNHGFAAVDFAETNKLIAAKIGESKVKLHIVPGFIASDSGGYTTTLGRGGSDYTGAIFAAALDAGILEIWTDVSGMMTADPRFVRNVRQIPRINYREAMELSHFGAKVIYPPTLQPVMAKGIPVWIKNTFAPDDIGTLIEAESVAADDMVRGITSIDKICVLSLEGSGMVGIPGFSKRLFDALSRAEINVVLITQSSSEHSICVAIEEKLGEVAKRVVDREFEYEINIGKIDPLKVENGFSILALVGDRMKEHTGVSGKMFTTLGHNGINIHAIAQGSSERNISAIISSKDVRKAVNTLHEEFFSDGRKQVNLFIVGVGTVGSRLLEQLRQQHEYLLENMRLNVRVVGLANSKRLVFNEEGIDLDDWKTLLTADDNDSVLPSETANVIRERNLRNSVFVDVT
ncbi:MAG: aspartate kinase, partial [Acidobacteria bacterium]|nr:aspartate kinase [Acidobacteriota bacterium]